MEEGRPEREGTIASQLLPRTTALLPQGQTPGPRVIHSAQGASKPGSKHHQPLSVLV